MVDYSIDRELIATRLARLQDRIAAACQHAGRSAEEVTLIGVTKTFPPELVEVAYATGMRDFGENRVQELIEKASFKPGIYQGGDVKWHMIGHLQRNKAKDVVTYADCFHGLDSLRLARVLEKQAASENRILPCMIQVNISGESSKFGIEPDKLPSFLDRLVEYTHLQICGLMGIAAYDPNPETARPAFRRLRLLAEAYQQRPSLHHDLKYLSMGMSGDFETAIEEGATHIRVGTALFGTRS